MMGTETLPAKKIKEELKEKVRDFPVESGVYLMKSLQEKIIYVGKAKNLRSRVRSYFSESKDVSVKTKYLMRNVASIEYIVTGSEVEAFLLEASLIKKHRPRYNIRLKDDKAYPYIQASIQDSYPRFYLARKVKKDGSVYFGPYTSGLAVHETIRFLNRTFKIRDCSDGFMKSRTRPCMTHQIGRCTAPCVNEITQKDYGQDMESALLFLRGNNKKVIQQLKKQMKQVAKGERFEAAARLRDSISAIERVQEKQAVVNDTSELDQDVINFHGDERGTLIETLHVRHGRVIGNRPHFMPLLDAGAAGEDVREWLTSFVNQYYEDNFIPNEVYLPVDLGGDLTKLLEDVLRQRADNEVKVCFPTDDFGHRLLVMAEDNARSHFDDYVTKSKKKRLGLEMIQQKLSLPEMPYRIECYDISTFQGKETVASQVVFEEGVPSKDHYRRYKIKSVQGTDDYASMKEVLSRRFKHVEYSDPQLIVIDGGKGQLNIADRVLKEIGRPEIPVVGLAKSRTRRSFQDQEIETSKERFFVPGRQNPVTFAEGSEAFQILVGIRDEAHRFAITFHRKLRENTSLESELDFVVGLGAKRKKQLLKEFSSVEALKNASPEDIASLRGFNRVLAERILIQLKGE